MVQFGRSMAALCALLTSPLVAGQQTSNTSNSCVYPDRCLKIPYVDAGLNASYSPFYDLLQPDVGGLDLVDNSCTTLFPFDSCTWLFIRSTVYKDKTVQINKYIYSVVEPGVFRATGVRDSSGCTECSFTDYTLGTFGPPCAGVFALYRCPSFGACVGKYCGQDIRLAFSSCRDVPAECVDRVIALANANPLFLGNQFVAFPNLLPRRCVTCFNGARCVNAHSVRPCDAISLPECDCDCAFRY